jgi:hypothetical protein
MRRCHFGGEILEQHLAAKLASRMRRFKRADQSLAEYSGKAPLSQRVEFPWGSSFLSKHVGLRIPDPETNRSSKRNKVELDLL